MLESSNCSGLWAFYSRNKRLHFVKVVNVIESYFVIVNLLYMFMYRQVWLGRRPPQTHYYSWGLILYQVVFTIVVILINIVLSFVFGFVNISLSHNICNMGN